MGLISNIFFAGAGLALGYVLWYPNLDRCQGVYQRELIGIEEQYSSGEKSGNSGSSPVAGLGDISIDYLISEKSGGQPGIKGFLFTDMRTGEEGVLIKKPALFQNRYNLEYTVLDQKLTAVEERVSLVSGERNYRIKEKPGPLEDVRKFACEAKEKVENYAQQKGIIP